MQTYQNVAEAGSIGILLTGINGVINQLTKNKKMDRDEARKAAEVMLAYAEGKEIECKTSYEPDYRDVEMPLFDWGRCDYRVKSEPKYRPFYNAEECWQEMLKHQPFGWLTHKSTMGREMIAFLDGEADHVNISSMPFRMKDIFQYYTFADGSVLGVKEE